jgi:hypothetical protein
MQSIHIRNYYNISLSSLRADPKYFNGEMVNVKDLAHSAYFGKNNYFRVEQHSQKTPFSYP